MKINPNINKNSPLQPEIDKATSGGKTAFTPPADADRLESFAESNPLSFGGRAGGEVKGDLAAGASLITGGKSFDFGFSIPPDFLTAIPEAETETRDGIFDAIGYGLVDATEDMNNWLGNALEYLGYGIAETPETFDKGMEYLGQGLSAAGEAVSDAAEAVSDAAEWVGETVADAVGDLFSW